MGFEQNSLLIWWQSFCFIIFYMVYSMEVDNRHYYFHVDHRLVYSQYAFVCFPIFRASFVRLTKSSILKNHLQSMFPTFGFRVGYFISQLVSFCHCLLPSAVLVKVHSTDNWPTWKYNAWSNLSPPANIMSFRLGLTHVTFDLRSVLKIRGYLF